MRDRVGAV